MELLAPAGNFPAIHAAIEAGADSIFFGAGKLNMRNRNAYNFTVEELPEIAKICKDSGVRSYLTLNITLFDEELEEMKRLVNTAKDCGIDAVIAQDMACIQAAVEANLSVHISTQMSLSNIDSVRFYARFADTVVLARELSLKKIAEIIRQVHKENICGPSGERLKIEIFGHGALCIAQSGRCFMSMYQFNSSANRGQCLQSCRREYKLTNVETGQSMQVENNYILSPEDISTVGIIPRLKEIGVDVLKIEGRSRDPLYVKRVIEVYRQAIDMAESHSTFKPEQTEAWLEKLKTVYNRGLNEGYYLDTQVPKINTKYGSRSKLERVFAGKIHHYYDKAKIAEAHITAETLSKGQTFVIQGKTSGLIEGKIVSLYQDEKAVEHSEKPATVTFPVEKKVRKGDQLFILKQREITL